jgi:hypothetical protein
MLPHQSPDATGLASDSLVTCQLTDPFRIHLETRAAGAAEEAATGLAELVALEAAVVVAAAAPAEGLGARGVGDGMAVEARSGLSTIKCTGRQWGAQAGSGMCQ